MKHIQRFEKLVEAYVRSKPSVTASDQCEAQHLRECLNEVEQKLFRSRNNVRQWEERRQRFHHENQILIERLAKEETKIARDAQILHEVKLKASRSMIQYQVFPFLLKDEYLSLRIRFRH